MKFKKFVALTLVVSLVAAVAACGNNTVTTTTTEAAETTTEAAETTEGEETEPAETTEGEVTEPEDVSSAPEWDEYDALIAEIKAETDMANREALMHQAEDMLMETGALMPLYYYNDAYLMKDGIEGVYTTAAGYKYFHKATYGDNDTISINLASEPDKLDPALNSTVDGAVLAIMGFSGLYTYDENGALQPDSAEGVEISDDKLTYTFTLKDGLLWSDGEPLDASDFEYSWKRAANPETAADYSYLFESIAGYPDSLEVTASEDGKTLTVVLNAPTAYFLDLAAFPVFFPVPEHVVEASESDEPGGWALEAGFPSNGPFNLVDWEHKSSMRYEKNENYHNADVVQLAALEFMLSDDQASIFAAYQAGDIDFADTIPQDEYQNLLDDPEFYVADQLGTYYVNFNVNSPLFEGKTVEEANAMRKGLSLLVDRAYIVEAVGQTGQVVANTFIPAGMADGQGGVFKQDDADFTYPVEGGYFPLERDVEGAIALLEEAGFVFENGVLSADTPIALEYSTNTSDAHEAIAQIIQQDFAEIGIEMTISSSEWNVFLNDRKAGNYDVARNGWIADYNDPINMLEMWTSTSGNNDVQFGK